MDQLNPIQGEGSLRRQAVHAFALSRAGEQVNTRQDLSIDETQDTIDGSTIAMTAHSTTWKLLIRIFCSAYMDKTAQPVVHLAGYPYKCVTMLPGGVPPSERITSASDRSTSGQRRHTSVMNGLDM
jgi:hypothetical protein